ncbi:MAG: hypothetical protein AB7F19_06280 [Candidatus Babeliales bacterium]
MIHHIKYVLILCILTSNASLFAMKRTITKETKDDTITYSIPDSKGRVVTTYNPHTGNYAACHIGSDTVAYYASPKSVYHQLAQDHAKQEKTKK